MKRCSKKLLCVLTHPNTLSKREQFLYLKGVYDCVYRYIFNESTTDNMIGEIKVKSFYCSPEQDMLGG